MQKPSFKHWTEQSDPKAAGTISSPIRKSALLRSSSSSQAWMPTSSATLLWNMLHCYHKCLQTGKDWKWKQNTAERISEFDAKVLKWGSMQSLARSSAASRVTFGATQPRDGCCELNGITCPIPTHKLKYMQHINMTWYVQQSQQCCGLNEWTTDQYCRIPCPLPEDLPSSCPGLCRT